jgi:hypothetical protein
MHTNESAHSERVSDWIVIPIAMAITTVVSLAIFSVSISVEAGIGWFIAVLVIFLVVQRIDRSRTYGSAIRVGMALGVGVSYVLVRWFFWE